MERVEIDLAIIGGGVTGLATAYKALEAMPGKSVAVFEKNLFLAEEQSGRNSGVVHGGIYYRTGSKKAVNCVEGNRELYSFCPKNDIAIAQTGKVIVATNLEEKRLIKDLLEKGRRNNVQGLEIITAEEVRHFEPNVNALCALYSPTTGIIDAAGYVKTLDKLVKKRGGMIFTDATVEAISPVEDRATLWVRQSGEEYDVIANYVVNAAGLHADTIGKMINPQFPYQLQGWKGEYMIFNSQSRTELAMRGLNVYPTPKIIEGLFDEQGNHKITLGTHLTPRFEYNAEGVAQIGKTLLVGPKGYLLDGTIRKPLRRSDFVEDLKRIYPHLRSSDLQKEMVGIQVKVVGYDNFVLEKDRRFPYCIHAIADSPGLTASLANAEEIVGLMKR